MTPQREEAARLLRLARRDQAALLALLGHRGRSAGLERRADAHTTLNTTAAGVLSVDP